MRTARRFQEVLTVIGFSGLLLASLAPLAAQASGAGGRNAAGVVEVADLSSGNGPCGIQSLRGQGGYSGGSDVLGIWRCVKQVLMPARLRDSESESPAIEKKDALKWGVRVRQDQVLISIGVKW